MKWWDQKLDFTYAIIRIRWNLFGQVKHCAVPLMHALSSCEGSVESFFNFIGSLLSALWTNYLPLLSEIDVFVLVACPENSLLDSKEYLKPIITPFELDVALNSDRMWTGHYYANFR